MSKLANPGLRSTFAPGRAMPAAQCTASSRLAHTEWGAPQLLECHGEHGGGVANQDHVRKGRGDAVREARDVAALRLPSCDQHDGLLETGKRGLDRVEIRGLGVIPVRHAVERPRPLIGGGGRAEASCGRIEGGIVEALGAPPGRRLG